MATLVFSLLFSAGQLAPQTALQKRCTTLVTMGETGSGGSQYCSVVKYEHNLFPPFPAVLTDTFIWCWGWGPGPCACWPSLYQWNSVHSSSRLYPQHPCLSLKLSAPRDSVFPSGLLKMLWNLEFHQSLGSCSVPDCPPCLDTQNAGICFFFFSYNLSSVAGVPFNQECRRSKSKNLISFSYNWSLLFVVKCGTIERKICSWLLASS